MRNAWGQFDGVQRLGLGSLVFTLLYATLVGCDPLTIMEESDPSKLSVMYSGCHTVQEGPLCELPKLDNAKKTASLTLHIELPDIPTIVIRSPEGQTTWNTTKCSEETCVKTEIGHRIVLSVPASAQELVVESANPDISDWTLSIISFQERPAVMSDAVALEQSSQRDEALQLLETALPTLAPHWQAEAMSHVARMYKRLGRADEALQSFEQSMDLHLQTGGLSHYVRDGTAAVHTLIMDAGMQLNQARDLASSLRGILPQHYESQHFYHWASLFGANKANAHQNALYHGLSGSELARRLGNNDFERYHALFVAHTYKKTGRASEAERILEAGAPQFNLETNRCEDAEALNTLGFIQWLRLQEASKDEVVLLAKKSLKNFQDAYQISKLKCSSDNITRLEINNSLVNLALGYLANNDIKRANEALNKLYETPQISLFHHEWGTQIRAEIYLKTGRAKDALIEFETLATLSEGVVKPYLQLWSILGKARAHQMLGHLDDSLTYWNEANLKIEEEGLLIPIHESRELYLAQYQRIFRDLIEYLVKANRPKAALAMVRSHRSQLLRGLAWQNRLANLNNAERMQWQNALGRFKVVRAELAELRQSSWSIPKAELAKHNAEKYRLEVEAANALHGVLSSISYRVESTEYRYLNAPDSIRLTYFSTAEKLYQFVETSEATRVRWTTVKDTIDLSEQLVKNLIEPELKQLRRAKKIHLSPGSELAKIDFHALQIHGNSLTSIAPILYDLSIPVRPRTRNNESSIFLVVDPSGNLPEARREGQQIQTTLSTHGFNVETLSGSAAVTSAIIEKMQDHQIFHYAGHGEFDESNPTFSSLLLGKDTQLTVSDILALTNAPETVILSACETAMVNVDSSHDSIGIAQAFLTAGTTYVVASTRKVDDTLSRFLMKEFYESFSQSKNVESAFQFAQRQAATKLPDSDWATYRLITRN